MTARSNVNPVGKAGTIQRFPAGHFRLAITSAHPADQAPAPRTTREASMGILIIKGSRLRLEDLSIRLDGEGNVETGPTTITQAIDIWPEWLQIAIEAEARAAESRRALDVIAYLEHDERHAKALGTELRASLVALAAVASTFDSFHDSLRRRLRTQPDVGKRSARWRLIAETIRRAFVIPQSVLPNLRQPLQQIFRFRDLGVHPSADFQGPVTHPAMQAGVHPLYAINRHENAATATAFAITILAQLPTATRDTEPEVRDWIEASLPPEIARLDALRCSNGPERIVDDTGSWIRSSEDT